MRCLRDSEIVEVERIDDDTYAVTFYGVRILIDREQFEKDYLEI